MDVIFSKIRNLDAYPKINEDFYSRTLSGGVITLVSSFIMLLLFFPNFIKSLLGTKVEWLYYIMQAFNSGDLVRYQELCRVHGEALNAQPALVANEKNLLEKINILCLMEIIFSRGSEDRTIPLGFIAERTRLFGRGRRIPSHEEPFCWGVFPFNSKKCYSSTEGN